MENRYRYRLQGLCLASGGCLASQQVTLCQQLNFKKADWTQFHNTLQYLTANALLQMQQQPLPILDAGLEQGSTILRDTLLLATSQSFHLLRPSPRSKPWWNDDLTTKRQQMHQRKRRWKTTRGDEEWKAFQASRNVYFHAIRLAKQANWRTFLQQPRERTIPERTNTPNLDELREHQF